jgi:hypothetical protein
VPFGLGFDLGFHQFLKGFDMKTTISLYDFREAFQRVRPNQFSYSALGDLFEYLEDWEESSGNEIELDVIAICCDFAEDTWQYLAESYDIDLSDCDDDAEKQRAVADYLCDQGQYVSTVGESFVYRQF